MKGRPGPKMRIIKAARKMPPLYHKLPNEEFGLMKSKALLWLLCLPEVREYIWNLVSTSDSITYDPFTHKWSGVDFEMEDDE